MSWPNSMATRPQGVPSTFPGNPANDNWRMPRTNSPWRGPSPANDNAVPKPKSRGMRLPGVLKRLPGPLGVGAALLDLWFRVGGEPGYDMGPWQFGAKCATASPTHYVYQTFANTVLNHVNTCLAFQSVPNAQPLPVTTAPGQANHRLLLFVELTSEPGGSPRYTYAEAWYREIGTPAVAPQYKPGTARPVFLRPQMPAVYPGFYPPLLQPAFEAPPPMRPGNYKGPKQIMAEWPDSGYSPPGEVAAPRTNQLESRRPPRRTKERKVRARDYAIGRTIEWLVSNATESLDMQRALFEALPFWRIMQIYNAARNLEVKYVNGRVVAGRLHYRDLTPAEKMKAIYDYIDEIDVAKAVENAVKMQLTDMFWAEIGRRMGRRQIGPWDDHGYRGPEKPAPEWEWYIPDIAPDTEHAHWTYETLVNRRLTQQEAQRIHTLFDNYRHNRIN